jgi:hypothetical protein
MGERIYYSDDFGDFGNRLFPKFRARVNQYSCPHGAGIWYDERPSYSCNGEEKHYRNKYRYPYNYDSFYCIGSPETVTGSSADYTDRMVQWAYSDKKYDRKLKRGLAAIGRKCRWDQMTMVELDAFVKGYYGINNVATGLVESCNQSTGYPVWAVFHRKMTTKEIKEARKNRKAA